MINKLKMERERNRDKTLKMKYCIRHNIHIIWYKTEYHVDPSGLVWGSDFLRHNHSVHVYSGPLEGLFSKRFSK